MQRDQATRATTAPRRAGTSRRSQRRTRLQRQRHRAIAATTVAGQIDDMQRVPSRRRATSGAKTPPCIAHPCSSTSGGPSPTTSTCRSLIARHIPTCRRPAATTVRGGRRGDAASCAQRRRGVRVGADGVPGPGEHIEQAVDIGFAVRGAQRDAQARAAVGHRRRADRGDPEARASSSAAARRARSAASPRMTRLDRCVRGGRPASRGRAAPLRKRAMQRAQLLAPPASCVRSAAAAQRCGRQRAAGSAVVYM